MGRLRALHIAAMDRNRTVLVLDCLGHEGIDSENARRSRAADHFESREAQFDVEGAIDWRDLGARRCGE